MTKAKIAIAFIVAALLLTWAAPVGAYLIEDGGELWWDDPAVSEGEGWVEVIYNGDAPYLLEHTLVYAISDGGLVWEQQRDTGVTLPYTIGVGLVISDAFTIVIDTDDFANGEQYEIWHRHRWEARDITSTVEFPICLMPIDADGNLVAVDENCGWTTGTFTGTGGITTYLSFIYKNWGLPPIRH